jgi:hypothetical protein
MYSLDPFKQPVNTMKSPSEQLAAEITDSINIVDKRASMVEKSDDIIQALLHDLEDARVNRGLRLNNLAKAQDDLRILVNSAVGTPYAPAPA